MQIIDEGLFIKLLPDEGMILTDKATETMRAGEIDLAISDSADNYKDIPAELDIDPQDFEINEDIFLYPVWDGNGVDYKIGNKVSYNNILYAVVRDHTSRVDWAPDNTIGLFERIS